MTHCHEKVSKSEIVNFIITEKKNRVNSLTNNEVISLNDTEAVKAPINPAPAVPPKPLVDNNTDDNVPSWRRPVPRQTKVEPNKTASFSK